MKMPTRPTHLAALLLLSCAASSLRAQAPLPPWITVDSAARSVAIDLTVDAGAAEGPARINDHERGGIQLVVPQGWTVRWSWRNADSTASHSLVVMAEREKLPLEGGRPALDNAWTRSVTQGLKPGQRDVTTFVADQAGWYWMLCGVPGHAIGGEWIGLKVDREATVPALVVKVPAP